MEANADASAAVAATPTVEERIGHVESILQAMQLELTTRLTNADLLIQGLQGDVATRDVRLKTGTEESIKKMASLAQPILDDMQLKSVTVTNEVVNIKAGCDLMYKELAEKHQQVEDFAREVRVTFGQVKDEVAEHFNKAVHPPMAQMQADMGDVKKGLAKLENDVQKAVQELAKNTADLATKVASQVA